jgi:hypothetical protein
VTPATTTEIRWSEIEEAFQELKENLEGIVTKIETAKKHHGKIWHGNFKPQYTPKLRVVQHRFVVLKRRLDKLAGFSQTLDELDSQISILANIFNDISNLQDASLRASILLKSLGLKIRVRKEEEFDIFTTHRRDVAVDRKLCFVMMPFKPPNVFNPVYTSIRRAVRGKGLKCIRSDNVFDTRAIIIDIWEKTRKAVVCIADTSPPNNPNVFYEIGLAHGLPTRVILISRKLKPDEKYPFDISYARCIFYDQTVAGYRLRAEHFANASDRLDVSTGNHLGNGRETSHRLM